MAQYFGAHFSDKSQHFVNLAARGQENAAILEFQAGSFRPTAAEYKSLTTCLIDIKATELASAIAQKIYRENPRAIEAIQYAALTELYCQRPDEAIKIASEGSKFVGQNPSIHHVVGLAMMSVGSLENAGSIFQAALQMSNMPPLPIAFSYLGEVLRLMGRTNDALALHTKCFQSGCTDAEAYFLAGNAHYDAGQIDTAISHYQKAITQKPYYLDAHDVLNKTLWEHGRRADFMKSFETAARELPQVIAIQLRHAYFRILAGKLAEAANQLENCLTTFGPNARVYAELANVKQQLDENFDALPLYEKAYELDATDINMLKAYGRALIGKAQYARAAEILTECKAIESSDQECLAYLATCHSHITPAEAQRVNDYKELVQVFDLKAPTGYASQADFNTALLQALQPYHRTDNAPIDQTLINGTQTHGMLFNKADSEIKVLENQLRDCIHQYIQHLQQAGPDEMKNRISGAFDFSGSWSVQLSDGGHHRDHVHSAGWISSVYYVEVPEDLDTTSHEGWLKFGDAQFDPNNTGPNRFVQPMQGRLVLFPSYMVHGTVPIQAGKRRTTIAFDVVPH